MLIGIDASRAVARQRTGTEAYSYFLIRALIPAAARRGHTLRLYYNSPPPPSLFPHDACLEDRVIPFPRLWTHIRLAWELRQHPPDVFFTPAHVIPIAYRRASVATIHDMGYLHFSDAHPWRQLTYLRWSTRHNARVTHRLVVDSLATQRDLAYFDKVAQAKIVAVYPGADPDLHPVKDEAAITAVLRKYAITPPYLLFVSTLQPRKNLIRLIEAFTQAQTPHQLVLAGKVGWLAQPILEAIAAHRQPLANGDDSIITPGFVADADKAALISGATAVLYPSLYEGFGFPVLEAQACGVPVLCANTSSLPEVAGEAALLVNPLDTAGIRDGIRQLVRDPLLRAELVERGLENVKRFTWEETAGRILDVLEEAGSG